MNHRHAVAKLTRSESAVANWARRRLGRIGHERRVLSIADRLFKLTQHLHQLDISHRHLLRIGALLHDVGRQLENKRHPLIGAQMILEDTQLKLNASERRQMAYLTRYHRGAVPETRFDDILQNGDQRKSMRKVLAILRAADTLDGRNCAVPRISMDLKDRNLRIVCLIEDSKAHRALGRRKKFRLLEELLGCRVEFVIKGAAISV